MSIVQETACAVNGQLDLLQQQIASSSGTLVYAEDASPVPVRQLQNVIGLISVTSKTQPFLSPKRLADLLEEPALTHQASHSRELHAESEPTVNDRDVSNHLWLVAAKAAVQASGLVMHSLLDQTLQLQDETYYWNEVLGSKWNSSLYAAQTAPVRLWHWSKDLPSLRDASSRTISESLAARWAQFYQIARRSVSEYPVPLSWASPIRSCRSEARRKRDRLSAMMDIHTSSLGLLMESWHFFQAEDFVVPTSQSSHTQWQETVSRIVVLTEAIVRQATDHSNVSEFEEQVFSMVKEEKFSVHVLDSQSSSTQAPVDLIQRLLKVLRDHLPAHSSTMSTFVAAHGRPSRVTRYWIPVVMVLLSSSASLKFLARRQNEILEWIANFGATIIDFGSNWVVEPVRKLIGTIRHDEKSEIAIMSKNSLVADRASLERMVMDFVRDRPDTSQGVPSAQDTAAITNAVKEGDLTPVLKAYERDLRTPFVGTVKGDLVRALLIQIQKTKVDVEIAISGIDALLKSQELVFGFVGLTPGIMVTYASLRWMAGLLGNRRGLKLGRKRHDVRRGFRNVTRVLTSVRSSEGIMSYKESGRLICEAESLLLKIKQVLGGVQYQEFREDIQDLLNVESGVDKQLRVVDRMRWTYFQ
ncbi:Uncharacterized protein PECH_002321 [Penicillium ucsense]|uniref:Nuclear control of ATPase protein 2 n=1 Tax=Penicillium ucsense TaxID=2839758 RepID=A0A8J8VWS1_9EURO|nr:Uncharacterized protein PECM_001920 [Penicillium ucsense]KAF7731027.1 Uncharacterized protein PECH_002321 [Penicillium ucsense]